MAAFNGIDGGEVFDEFEALGFAAAEGVEGLTEGKVAEANVGQGGEAAADGGLAGKEVESVLDGHGEEVGDGFAFVGDAKDVGFEALAFAFGAEDVEVGHKLHFDFFIAEAETVFAASVAGIKGEVAGGPIEAFGFFCSGKEGTDAVPNVAVQSGIGAGSTGNGRLIDQDDFVDFEVGIDGVDACGVFSTLAFLREEALVDCVVQKGGFARTGDACEADKALEGQAKVEPAEVVLADVLEGEGRRVLGGAR